jgi:MFS transporter, DHA1 family, tetracycline resistance protein
VPRSPRTPLPPGFGSLWSTVVLDLVGFGIIIPVLPLYAEDMGASTVTIGLVLSAYSLAQLIGAPVLGRLSDRYGRRPVLVISLVGSAIGHLVTGLAGTIWVVLLARLLDGFSGGSLSIAHAAVADVAEPAERPRLFGLLGAGIAIGFVAGPAIGALAGLGGAHVPFFVAAALTGLNAATAWWRLPETRPRADAPSASPHLAFGGLGRFLLRGDRLSSLVAAGLFGGLAFSGFEATFSLMARARVGLTPVGAGLAFAGIGILLSVVQGFVVGRVVRRFGELPTARAALATLVVGFLALVPVAGWVLLVPGLVLLTVGQGLLTPALSAAVAGASDAGRRGATFGIQQAAGALSRVIGPLVALGLFGLWQSLPYVLSIGFAATAIALLARAASRAPVPASS